MFINWNIVKMPSSSQLYLQIHWNHSKLLHRYWQYCPKTSMERQRPRIGNMTKEISERSHTSGLQKLPWGCNHEGRTYCWKTQITGIEQRIQKTQNRSLIFVKAAGNSVEKAKSFQYSAEAIRNLYSYTQEKKTVSVGQYWSEY